MPVEPEIFHTKVVGVTFEGRQYALQALERLSGEQKDNVTLTLRREPDNQYDPNAIAVDVTYYESMFLSDVTKPLGYIKKEIAESLAEEMQNGVAFDVLDWETTGGYNKTRGVNISLLRREASMPKYNAMDLLNKKSGVNRDSILKLEEGKILKVRFLAPLAEAVVQATYSLKFPNGKTERFEALEGDDPAEALGIDPWIKFIIPVIDRTDGKTKLFQETPAVYKKLRVFEETTDNDLEKSVKIGGLTNADIQIMQQGKGKDRVVTVFPDSGTIRPLNADELKAKKDAPDPKSLFRILNKQEVQKIVDLYIQATNGGSAQVAVDPFKKN